jgi:hypothetical protein
MLSQPTVALAAQTGSLQRRDPERELWLVRSETITEELKKDAADRQGDLNGMRGALNPPERLENRGSHSIHRSFGRKQKQRDRPYARVFE